MHYIETVLPGVVYAVLVVVPLASGIYIVRRIFKKLDELKGDKINLTDRRN